MSDSKANPLFRLATFSDTVFIARLLREFYDKAGGGYGIHYDHESMLVTIDDVIRHGVCVVGSTSCAAAYVELFPCNSDLVVANVRFWYFQKPREIAIFEALSDECKRQGATHITASSHAPDHTVGRYYERMGMMAIETVYLGKIENCCKPSPKRVRAEIVNTEQSTLGGA